MKTKATALLTQLKGFWDGLSTAKRLALIVVTSGVLVGVMLVAHFGSQPRFAYLYTELSTEDAAAIVEKLNAQQVPHKLDANGTAIQVPEDRVHALRLELAGAGLPRGGGVGFELFDKSQIGATEFEQRVNLRRALEGELSRSINTVQGVRSSRVHLVLPERRLFAAREESASASVVLKLDNPTAFGKREVAGIVHLVSSAVPGLARDRVSVVSTEGLTLHRPVSDTGAVPGEMSDVQVEAARGIAAQMEGHVREQLERVVGPGNADVRVHVDLETATKERTEEHYEPSKTALRSEHKVEEGGGTEEAGVAGVPGARSNLPDAVPEGAAPPEEALAAPAAGGGALRRSHTRNWEVDRVTQKTSMPAGSVRRVSAAVLLNGRYEQRDGSRVFVGRSKAELAALEAIVQRAIGFDKSRGDDVQLQTLEFARVEEPTSPPTPPLPLHRRYWQYFAAGGALLFLLALVVLVRRSRKKARALAKAQALKESKAAELGPKREVAALLMPRENAELIKGRALALAAEDPATAAVVLRKWLNAPSPAAQARS